MPPPQSASFPGSTPQLFSHSIEKTGFSTLCEKSWGMRLLIPLMIINHIFCVMGSLMTVSHKCTCTHTHTHTHTLSHIVGNKNDCPEKKVVQTEDAQKFSEQIGIDLYETSAKENINVEEVSA